MTIYLDLSTSYQWRRNPVGVVRVEREFARNLREQIQGIRFCRIDATHGSHVLLSDPEVDSLLSEAWCRPAEEQVRPATPTAAHAGMIATIRPFVPNALVQAVERVLGALHEIAKPKVRAVKSESIVAMIPQGLGKGDVFVSVGADWDHLPAERVETIKRQTGCQVVLACYDTIVVDFPEYAISEEFGARLRKHLVGLGQNADLVVAISESTKKDLLRFWQKEDAGARGRDVVAIPLASALPPTDVARPSRSERLDALKEGGPYVIYVSTLEARKNHRLLFNLWREFHADHRNEVPRLVLVGAKGWGVDDLLWELQHSAAGRDGYIQFWSDVGDELLQGLYANCEFGVFPSFYEGWGLAATELLACGKTCVVSTGSSLQEATQGLCPSLHPCDHLGWREEILRLSRDKAYRGQREFEIASRFHPRTWADCSAEFGATLLSLTGERHSTMSLSAGARKNEK